MFGNVYTWAGRKYTWAGRLRVRYVRQSLHNAVAVSSLRFGLASGCRRVDTGIATRSGHD